MGGLDRAGDDSFQRFWRKQRSGLSNGVLGGAGSFPQLALLVAEHAFRLAWHSHRSGSRLAGVERLLRALSRRLGLALLEAFPGRLRNAGSIRRHRLVAAPGLGFCGGSDLDCPRVRARDNYDGLPVEFHRRVPIQIAALDPNCGHHRHLRRFIPGRLDLRIVVRRGPEPGATPRGTKRLDRRGTPPPRGGRRGEFWGLQSGFNSSAGQGVESGLDPA